MKFRIEFEYAPYPLDKLWLEVSLTDSGLIVERGERFGDGAVYSSRDAREYKFSLYEISEIVAGLDWYENEYAAGELHILKRRLTVGDEYLFKDAGETYYYKIKKLLNSLNPLRRVSCFPLRIIAAKVGPNLTEGDRDMKSLLCAAFFLSEACSSAFAAEAFKLGQNVAIADWGWVCHSLEKAIASRIIGPFEKAKVSNAT